VTAFVGSNRFREDLPQYGNAASTTFVTATSDTLEITNAALRCLESIYVPGIMYKRSGVMVGDIVPSNPLQLDLFDTNTKRKERNELMRVLDSVNQRYGVKTLHLAVEDTPISYGAFGGGWHVKCEHRSPNYLTDINEILTIKI
jgi:DNA polymerase V